MAIIEMKTSNGSHLSKDSSKDIGELARDFFNSDGRLIRFQPHHVQSVSVDGKNMNYDEFIEEYGPEKARELHRLQSGRPDTNASNGEIRPGWYHNNVTGGRFFVSNWGGYWHDDHV